jgi:beta-glucanase (GH16 family)
VFSVTPWRNFSAAPCRLIPLAVCAAALFVATAGARQANATQWRQVWADEFNKDGIPDPTNWTYEHGLVRNDEAQWYQPQNASCRGGLLVIEARRERMRNSGFVTGSTEWPANQEYAEYTSSSLTTKGLHQWRYGRFELRARIDTRSGMWPAWWTLGVDGEWPAGGEIDMLEYYRGMLLANVAWGSPQRWVATWDSVRTPVASLGSGWPDGFHVWRMDWDAQAIRLYMDDRLLNETAVSDTIDASRHRDPFNAPHYMLLNLAIGGTNGGDPSASTFPARFEVDYVRVYEAVR